MRFWKGQRGKYEKASFQGHRYCPFRGKKDEKKKGLRKKIRKNSSNHIKKKFKAKTWKGGLNHGKKMRKEQKGLRWKLEEAP